MDGLHKCLLLLVLTCLRQNGHGSKIINGEKVPENLMRYMVSVQNQHGHMCGGFLISEEFVVTAAHCDKRELTKVVLGTHNLKEANKANTFSITLKCKPETYKNVSYGDDIMVLKLSRKAQLNNRVQTIQLPKAEINVKEKQQCRVAGWGKTHTLGHAEDELRMVDVSVIDPQVCKKQWKNLPDNVICAGGYKTDKGFCQGDSGGPLVCNGIAVGVVSFNIREDCDYPNAPNVYTDISKYVHWIHNIIKHYPKRYE